MITKNYGWKTWRALTIPEVEERTIPADDVWYIGEYESYGVKTKLTVNGKVVVDGKLTVIDKYGG